MDGQQRYIGDVAFDLLIAVPGFRDKARELVVADWREGTARFQAYASPLWDEIATADDLVEYWGESLNYEYLERRVVGPIESERDPWLWAYRQLTGALLDPGTVRSVLNRIERSA